MLKVNHTSVSSVGSITYEKCLWTDLDGANTLYADGHVTVILAREMTRAYSDVKLVPTAGSGVLLQMFLFVNSPWVDFGSILWPNIEQFH